jgi:cell division protein FtsZ
MEIFEVTESNANLDKKELYTYIDNTEFSDEIKEAIKGMLGVVISSGDNDINLDFDDLKVIMEHGGAAFVGTGEFEDENAVTQAIRLAIKNSSLNYDLIDKAAGMLIHLVIHPDLPMMEIAEAMNILYENAHYEADVIWGTTTDKSVSENYVKATILFAGFEKNILANNVEYKQ